MNVQAYRMVLSNKAEGYYPLFYLRTEADSLSETLNFFWRIDDGEQSELLRSNCKVVHLSAAVIGVEPNYSTVRRSQKQRYPV
jgi:hypothetical protein